MGGNNFEIDLSQFHDLYIEESQRYLLALNQGILDLEQNPNSERILEDVFRAAHTLKGMSATMGFETITTLAHTLEDMLQQVRIGSWAVTPKLISLTFTAIDTLEGLVNIIATGESIGSDISGVLQALQRYEPGTFSAAADDALDFTPTLAGSHEEDANGFEDALVISTAETPALSVESEVTKPDIHPLIERALNDTTHHIVTLDVRHLDRLLDVVTEMVIHRSYLMRLQQRDELQAIKDALFTHYQLLDSLQAAVLKTRMVPVRHVFNRFPRMVRDLLQEQGKDAQLIIEGETVEIDRTMLATLNDSLVHLLRNAIDHGLEPPHERQGSNKPPQGTLRLSAYNLRNSVVIEIGDDGRGMDIDRIGAVAVERGIVSAAELVDMNQAEILALICSPGFTLSQEVSKVSGRGVGMNAVKKQIESIRGALEIETLLGHGSTFRVKLPVNLAILDALLVQLGNELYAIPASQVERIEEIVPEAITRVGDKILLSLEDEIIPLQYLRNILDNDIDGDDARYALVIRRHEQALGLCVDEVSGYEQIVAKPLPAALRDIRGLSGVSILGEGQTVLILDLLSL